MKSNNKKRKKVGLALGSGGFRGSAHIGVIKVLLENDIPIDFVAGSSVGSLVGAHYCLFKDIKKTSDDFLKQQEKKYSYLRDLSFNDGFLSGKTFENDFRKLFVKSSFSDLKIPLSIISTDLVSGSSFIFNEGDLATAVRASISIPLAFSPLKFKDKFLVDGGMSNPVPDDVVRKMGADVVISVDLYNEYRLFHKQLDFSKVIMRSIEITLFNLSKNTLKDSDVVINPDSSNFSKDSGIRTYFSKDVFQAIMRNAEEETRKKISEIKKIIDL
ncbi:esterase [Candidatus Falkowbacteria bacterium HGW-Falkowbacteria-1]|uniref:Esterase n=1 Tax=Candidatus Falkowbacteria bacterium HGW-Falkowbacteria-1 TaxID=2013768 RepID=A0A2N2EA50_9BACT|nr:MAG: esterase [Candidatus Falkowbacteria bacterium HGW-Falkowbacteria-1]